MLGQGRTQAGFDGRGWQRLGRRDSQRINRIQELQVTYLLYSVSLGICGASRANLQSPISTPATSVQNSSFCTTSTSHLDTFLCHQLTIARQNQSATSCCAATKRRRASAPIVHLSIGIRVLRR
jgi:hypothetical protein